MGGQRWNEVKALEHDAEGFAAKAGQIVLAQAAIVLRRGPMTLPDVARSSPASSISSEVLPLPEGPTMATTSAGATRSETPLEDVERPRRHVQAVGHVSGVDDPVAGIRQ